MRFGIPTFPALFAIGSVIVTGMALSPSRANEQADLERRVAVLEAQVRVQSEDLSNAKRMASEFQSELASLGADTSNMKKDLGSLDQRVTKAESFPESVNKEFASQDKRLKDHEKRIVKLEKRQ